MAKKKKGGLGKLLIILLVIVIVGGGIIAAAAASGAIGGEDKGTTVETAKAQLKTITQLVSASGKMQPEVEVIISPDVSGEIIELTVKEGDFVKKGDLLVRIRPDIFEAQIDQLNANLLTQKARLEQNRAQYLRAEVNHLKQKELFDKKLISELEYITAKTDFQAQEANMKATRYLVQSAEAQLKEAKENLELTIIRSPMEGTISSLSVELGERVVGSVQMTGTEILRVARMEQMEVEVKVNENDIVSVALGDTAVIDVDAYPGKTFNGIVTEIANSARVTGGGTNEQVTDYDVKIRIASEHNLAFVPGQIVNTPVQEGEEQVFIPTFKPGMSATVDIQTETVVNVVAIPIQSVTMRDFNKKKKDYRRNRRGKEQSADSTAAAADSTVNNGNVIPEEDLRTVVFVVVDGLVKRHEVVTGINDDSHIQVLSGVLAGDELVIGGYRTLSRDLADGDKVDVDNERFARLASN